MKKLIYLTCLSIVFGVAGCKKVTDQLNPSGITAGNFYKTASDADNAINSCYDAFQTPHRYITWGDGMTDIFESTDRSSTTQIQIANGNLSADHTEANWNIMYTAVNRTNSVLKNVPNITDPALSARKERILGEAYFLRAMAYFYLVRTFENVPLILEPYENLSQDFYPFQAKPAEVFNQIELDFKAAAQRLTAKPYATLVENKGKATLGAVHAALADYYLWQKRYQEAADMALLVMNSTAGYALVSGDNYSSIFHTKNTIESVYEIQFNYQSYLETNTNNLVGQFLPLGGTNYAGGNWFLKPSAKLVALFTPGDKRISTTFLNTGSSPAPFRDPNQIYVNKYQGTLTADRLIRYSDSNAMIYRLADVILMRAEALNELDQTPAAILLLNRIRTRAGIVDTDATSKDDVRLAIENERFLELAFEGKRYYDLKRTGRYADVTGHIGGKYLRWPIASSQLVLNKNLNQNLDY